MQFRKFIGTTVALGLVAAAAFAPHQAEARAHGHAAYRQGHATRYASYRHYGGLQCVPFARENTGIELAGNAATWWSNAAGVYERGARPEVGSILNFRANGRMRLGHVSVVSNIVNARSIEVDHANWAGPGGNPGGVSRNITVVDVSPANDWSAVRVALGHTGEFGSIYPTYGFIYDRPDKGIMVANTSNAPAPILNTPPRDLRPASEQVDIASSDTEEVADAPDDAPRPRFGHRGLRFVHLAGRTRNHDRGHIPAHDRSGAHDRLASRDHNRPALLRTGTRASHGHAARHRT